MSSSQGEVHLPPSAVKVDLSRVNNGIWLVKVRHIKIGPSVDKVLIIIRGMVINSRCQSILRRDGSKFREMCELFGDFLVIYGISDANLA